MDSRRSRFWLGLIVATTLVAGAGCPGVPGPSEPETPGPTEPAPEPSPSPEPADEPEPAAEPAPLPEPDAGANLDAGIRDGGAADAGQVNDDGGVNDGGAHEDAGPRPEVPSIAFLQFQASVLSPDVATVVVSGTDADEDITHATYSIFSPSGVVVVDNETIEFIFGEVTFEDGRFVAFLSIPLPQDTPSLAEAFGEISIRLSDAQANISSSMTAAFAPPPAVGEPCLRGAVEHVTACVVGAFCAPVDDTAVGTCAATDADVPVLSSVTLFGFFANDFRCAFNANGQNLAQLSVVGTAQRSIAYLSFPATPFSEPQRRHLFNEAVGEGAIDTSLFVCTTSKQAIDEAIGTAQLVDDAGRASAEVAFAFEDIATEPPGDYTCGSTFDNADGCHCGCGASDPDCPDDTLQACTICSAPGSCSFSTCDVIGIDPVDVTQCSNVACGADLELTNAQPLFSTTELAPTTTTTTCGNGNGPEVAMAYTTSATATSVSLMVESIDNANHVVEVRSTCDDEVNIVECASNAGAGGTESLVFDVEPDTTYWIIVDTVNTQRAGSFRVTATES